MFERYTEGLINPDMLVEIEADAFIPDGSPTT
jgi:hypothetical protein